MERALPFEPSLPVPQVAYAHPVPRPPRISEQSGLVACALWLHAGYVGAALLVGGLLQLAGHEARPLHAIAPVFCGCVLAVAGTRRARRVIEQADRQRRLERIYDA